jgi:hypothetical protein
MHRYLACLLRRKSLANGQPLLDEVILPPAGSPLLVERAKAQAMVSASKTRAGERRPDRK